MCIHVVRARLRRPRCTSSTSNRPPRVYSATQRFETRDLRLETSVTRPPVGDFEIRDQKESAVEFARDPRFETEDLDGLPT